MIKEDRDEIERLLNLKVASMPDKNSCQRLIRKYINNGVSYCLSCDPSVRSMFKRLRSFWEKAPKNWRTIPQKD